MNAIGISSRLSALATIAERLSDGDGKSERLADNIAGTAEHYLETLEDKVESGKSTEGLEKTVDKFVAESIQKVARHNTGVSAEAAFMAFEAEVAAETARRLGQDAAALPADVAVAATPAPVSPFVTPSAAAEPAGQPAAAQPAAEPAASEPAAPEPAAAEPAAAAPAAAEPVATVAASGGAVAVDVQTTEEVAKAFVAETEVAGLNEASVDERLKALKLALERLQAIAETGGADERIAALFKKVDPAGVGDHAGGRPERFESFGADRRESFASASRGYAASQAATGAAAAEARTGLA